MPRFCEPTTGEPQNSPFAQLRICSDALQQWHLMPRHIASSWYFARNILWKKKTEKRFPTNGRDMSFFGAHFGFILYAHLLPPSIHEESHTNSHIFFVKIDLPEQQKYSSIQICPTLNICKYHEWSLQDFFSQAGVDVGWIPGRAPSFSRLAKSAPDIPGVCLAMAERSTPGAKFLSCEPLNHGNLRYPPQSYPPQETRPLLRETNG